MTAFISLRNLKRSGSVRIKKEIELNSYNTLPYLFYLMIIEKPTLNSIQYIEPVVNFKSNSLKINYSQSTIRIKRNIFSNLETSNLVRLNLEHNGIKKIDDFTFENLVNLRSLDLTGNILKRVFKDAFAGLNNLEILTLSHNKIKIIDDNSLQNLQKLNYLSFMDNQIDTIVQQTFNGLTNLETLNLSLNKINTIEDFTFTYLKKLSYLFLFNNNLVKISKKTFDGVIHLIRLDLQSNKIEFIEDLAFENLKDLSLLDLKDNPFQVKNYSVLCSNINMKKMFKNFKLI